MTECFDFDSGVSVLAESIRNNETNFISGLLTTIDDDSETFPVRIHYAHVRNLVPVGIVVL